MNIVKKIGGDTGGTYLKICILWLKYLFLPYEKTKKAKPIAVDLPVVYVQMWKRGIRHLSF